jgi:transcriptional regulator with XRE-family HTH domain
VAHEYLWAEYVRRVAPDKAQTEIAALAGVDQTGVSRWLSGQSVPRVESVIRFARSLGRAPIEGLVAAGYITPEEAGAKPDLEISIRDLPTEALLAEIRRRVGER